MAEAYLSPSKMTERPPLMARAEKCSARQTTAEGSLMKTRARQTAREQVQECWMRLTMAEELLMKATAGGRLMMIVVARGQRCLTGEQLVVVLLVVSMLAQG